MNGSPYETSPFVSVGKIENGISPSNHYALIESGYSSHFWGRPERLIFSEASNIPIIVIGDLHDPNGQGKKYHLEILLMTPRGWIMCQRTIYASVGVTSRQVISSIKFKT